MNHEKASQELARQVEHLRERAVISTDPNVVAKAIAVSDAAVRSLLLKYLSDGCEIAGVKVLTDLDSNSKRVFFEIRPEDARVNITSTGVLAVVDMATAEVTVTDPYDSKDEESASSLPFVLGIPPAASSPDDFTVSNVKQAREGNFFSGLGIDVPSQFMMQNPPPEKLPGPSHGGWGTTTYTQTVWPSITYNSVPVRADDTKGDILPEAADSGYIT